VDDIRAAATAAPPEEIDQWPLTITVITYLGDVQCVAIVAQYGGAPNIVAYASSWDTLRPTRIIRHRPCHRRDGTAGTPEHIYRCYRFRRLSRPRQCQGSLPTTGRVEQLFLWPLGPQSRTLDPPSHRFSYSLSLFSISPGLTGHRHGPAGPVSQVTRPSSRGPAAGPPEHDDERRRSVALGRHRAPRHPPPQPQPLKPLAPASAGTRPARSVPSPWPIFRQPSLPSYTCTGECVPNYAKAREKRQ
jgi:hypothetical protein